MTSSADFFGSYYFFNHSLAMNRGENGAKGINNVTTYNKEGICVQCYNLIKYYLLQLHEISEFILFSTTLTNFN